MARLTLKKLKILIQELFNHFEIELTVTEINRTRYRSHDYEGGACFYHVHTESFVFMIFYPLHDLEKSLNNGYELFLQLDKSGCLSDEIGLRKKQIK